MVVNTSIVGDIHNPKVLKISGENLFYNFLVNKDDEPRQIILSHVSTYIGILIQNFNANMIFLTI